MTKGAALVVLGAASSLVGCIVPRPFTSRTEIVTAADSTPVFGTQLELHVFDVPVVMQWDSASRAYREGVPGGANPSNRSLRVARLKGDVYLFQARLEPSEGYTLVPVRVSEAREATPLTCPAQQTVASDHGVRIGGGFDHERELRGDRAGILGMLAATLGTCTPWFRIATFVPPRRELVAAAAAPGPRSSDGCKPCPEKGCIQGKVVDGPGRGVSGVTARAKPRSSAAEAGTALSNDAGEFLVSGVPEGSHRLVVQSAGHVTLMSEFFVSKPGFTYLFETPFELKKEVGPDETIVVFVLPRQCAKRGERRHR